MKKHLDLLIYLSIVSFFLFGLVMLNGCGSNPTGGGNGGPPYDVSGALYGGTEEGAAIVFYATSEADIFSGNASSVEAEMGAGSYHITGLPSGTYYVAALHSQFGTPEEPVAGILIGGYNKVWGHLDPIVVDSNQSGKNITLGCWTGISFDFDTSYYIGGNITGGTTGQYVLVGIATTESGLTSGEAIGYVLKEAESTNPTGTYYFSGLPGGHKTYYIGAMQKTGWTPDQSIPSDPDYFGMTVATVESGNITNATIALQAAP